MPEAGVRKLACGSWAGHASLSLYSLYIITMDPSQYMRVDEVALIMWEHYWYTAHARAEGYRQALKLLRLNAETWRRWAASAEPVKDVRGLVAQFPALHWAELLLGEAEVLAVVLDELVAAGQVTRTEANGAGLLVADDVEAFVTEHLRPMGVCVEDMGSHWAFFLPE